MYSLITAVKYTSALFKINLKYCEIVSQWSIPAFPNGQLSIRVAFSFLDYQANWF